VRNFVAVVALVSLLGSSVALVLAGIGASSGSAAKAEYGHRPPICKKQKKKHKHHKKHKKHKSHKASAQRISATRHKHKKQHRVHDEGRCRIPPKRDRYTTQKSSRRAALGTPARRGLVA
jgi:3'-phosphoadenosine 5'-phosphosulfate (PAPS) 3'-phosphatase